MSGPVILDQEGAAFTLARRSVSGAGFALPRDAGPHREDWPEVGVPSPALLFVGETRAQATPGSTRTPIRRPVWPTAAPAAVIPQK